MLKTAAARVLINLGAHYDAHQLYFQADRAERLAHLVLSAAHDNLDDATFDALWGLSEEIPHYEWQTPGPDEQPTANTPVVTREQLMGLQAADGDPVKSAPYQKNMNWAEYSAQQASLDNKPAPSQQIKHSVPRDSEGKPTTGLKTKGGDGKFNGGFMGIEDIRNMIKDTHRHNTPKSSTPPHTSPDRHQSPDRRQHQLSAPAMAAA